MSNYPTQMPVYDTLQVLAAACASYRINQGYFKSGFDHRTGFQHPLPLDKQSNHVVMRACLAQPQDILDEDHDTATKVLSWYRGKLFRVLAGKNLSEFEHLVIKILEQPKCNHWDLNMLASVPDGYFRAMTLAATQQRIRDAQGGAVSGWSGQRVELECEPLQQIYSQKWQTWYITAVTPADQIILFSYREKVAHPSRLRIKGTIKIYENNITRLTRVRVLEAP